MKSYIKFSLLCIATVFSLTVFAAPAKAGEQCPPLKEVVHMIDSQGCFTHNSNKICNAFIGEQVNQFKQDWGSVGVLGGDDRVTTENSCTYIPDYQTPPPPCSPKACLSSTLDLLEKSELYIQITNDNEGSCLCGYAWRENIVFQIIPGFVQALN